MCCFNCSCIIYIQRFIKKSVCVVTVVKMFASLSCVFSTCNAYLRCSTLSSCGRSSNGKNAFQFHQSWQKPANQNYWHFHHLSSKAVFAPTKLLKLTVFEVSKNKTIFHLPKAVNGDQWQCYAACGRNH